MREKVFRECKMKQACICYGKKESKKVTDKWFRKCHTFDALDLVPENPAQAEVAVKDIKLVHLIVGADKSIEVSYTMRS